MAQALKMCAAQMGTILYLAPLLRPQEAVAGHTIKRNRQEPLEVLAAVALMPLMVPPALRLQILPVGLAILLPLVRHKGQMEALATGQVQILAVAAVEVPLL